ncbi:MAG: transglutaminase family protein [Planctomycetaceae bacterium]|nr:transglutaminase family protein [Planctomycetaceae bacterium]
MHRLASYDNDREFSKLLQRRADVDLAVVALELSRDAYPDLDFKESLVWIDQRARELALELKSSDHDYERLRKISRCLAERHDLQGSVKSFQSVDGSYLHRVIEQRHGLPIILSIIYQAVAEQVGIVLEGVAAPMHFLLCYQEGDEPLYLDPFAAGQIMNREDCLVFLSRRTSFSFEELDPYLKPARPRDIVIRMLNNLKALYAQEKNWEASLKVQQRLYSLEPGDYTARRDFGVIALHAGESGKAWQMLKACLPDASDEEKIVLAGYLNQAERQLSQWN